MKKPFNWTGGNDLHFSFNCTCPSELFKDSDIADIMKTTITLAGYADDFFFEVVHKEPRIYQCTCNKQYKYQWFRDGIECEEVI